MSLPPDQATPATVCVPTASFASAAGRTTSDFTATCVTASSRTTPSRRRCTRHARVMNTPSNGRSLTLTRPSHFTWYVPYQPGTTATSPPPCAPASSRTPPSLRRCPRPARVITPPSNGGSLTPPRPSHFTWYVPYQPGTTARTGPPCSRGSGAPFIA